MILSFTALDKNAEFRKFFCQLTELEVALDILSSVTRQGDTIIEAHVIDEGVRTELPPEAFDGKPLSESISQLEMEWQSILNEPVCSALFKNNWQVELTRQRIKNYEAKLIQLTQLINKFEQFRQRTERTPTYDGPGRDKLLQCYDSTIRTYQRYIDRAKAGQHEAEEKLSQLQEC